MKLTKSDVKELQDIIIPENVKRLRDSASVYLSKRYDVLFEIENRMEDAETVAFLKQCLMYADVRRTTAIAYHYDTLDRYCSFNYESYARALGSDQQQIDRGIGWLEAAIQYVKMIDKAREESRK